MTVFIEGDRVKHDNGKVGTVLDGWNVIHIAVKFDDGTVANVHRVLLAKI
jgi:hypothetical protein